MPLLAMLPDAARQRLSAHGRLRAGSDGAVIAEQGTTADVLIALLSGSATAVTHTGGGRRVAGESWKAPCVADKAGAFSRRSRAARLVANGPVVWCELPLDAVDRELDQHPDARRHVVGLLAAYADDLHQGRVRATTMTVQGRIAAWILENARGDLVLSVPTQDRLADRLGTTRVTVNRCLQALAARGAISAEPAAIRIVDRQILQDTAGQ